MRIRVLPVIQNIINRTFLLCQALSDENKITLIVVVCFIPSRIHSLEQHSASFLEEDFYN